MEARELSAADGTVVQEHHTPKLKHSETLNDEEKAPAVRLCM